MKVPLLSLALASAAVGGHAQDALLLNQAFKLHYTRWQSNQSASDMTQANYDFTLSMPVIDYRLGTLALTGALDYQRFSSEAGTQSALGLNTYGLRATLFPYRPFHLSLDYVHAQSPSLAGYSRVNNDVIGAALNYRGRTVQDLQITLRHGTASQAGEGESWSLSTLTANQQYGGTRVHLTATHQEFATRGSGPAFKDDFLYGSLETKLAPTWFFRTSVTAEGMADSHTTGLSADLMGQWGAWITQTNVGRNESESPAGRAASNSAAQSLIYSVERFSTFGAFSASDQSASAGFPGSRQGALTLGGSYALTAQWRVSADMSIAQVHSNGLSTGAGTSTAEGITRSFHLGISEGGDVPTLVKRALFYLSDQAFQRRVQDDYAPGYVPSELAQEMQRRRILQGGKLGFSSELFHIRNEQGGKMDWVRITGDLRMAEGLRIFTMGDLRRDDGLGLAGVHREERNLALNASELFGRSTLSGSVGFGRSEQSMTSTAQADLPAYLVMGDRASSSSFYTLNFNSSVGRFPYGILWTRYQASQSPAITTVGTHLDLNSGLLDVRFSVQVVRRQDGIRYTQFLVDLLRAFDTVALYRFGQR
ncbi:hypothetical protein [Geothrix edaphica]|uniref:TIGR03016 family PEP-CTERM system-associated outer membrane protein n=1 Tax=Geothrix edaphica TaxID=2927976 RepID=A0ABQ5PZB8_9BACT|nr:hypothetical protein [Geothrix edaphica]GLH67810.1 hypothetical protein GETHED_21740 [Geothrix edaphica]